jgi:hypothetical protein
MNCEYLYAADRSGKDSQEQASLLSEVVTPTTITAGFYSFTQTSNVCFKVSSY